MATTQMRATKTGKLFELAESVKKQSVPNAMKGDKNPRSKGDETAKPQPTTSGTNATPGKQSMAGALKLSAAGKRTDGPVEVSGAPRSLTLKKQLTGIQPEHTVTKQERAKPPTTPHLKGQAVAAPTLTPSAATNEPDTSEDDTNEAALGLGETAGGGGNSAGGTGKSKKPSSFSLAVLAGYEGGLQKPAPNLVSGSLRLLWHFDPDIAIGIRPAFRYGNVSSINLSASRAYQRSVLRVDSTVLTDSNRMVFFRRYDLQQNFDSIVASGSSAGGSLWSIELPIILSYKIAQAWHLYGGPSLTLGGRINSLPGSLTTYTIVRNDSVTAAPGTILPSRPASSFENHFGTSTLPDIDSYNPEEHMVKDPASMRLGYLAGLGYTWKRMILDASLHQQVSGFNEVPAPLRKIYTSPYLRLSLGYFIFPQKNMRRKAALD